MVAASSGGWEGSKSRTAQAATRARISQLDSQINSLQNSLAALLHERNHHQKELNAYTYPILTLPNEITSEIFTHFLPPFPGRSTLVGTLSPSILSHVCRQWRNVALSTPSLWTAIELNLDNPNRHHQQLRLLEAWLARSGNCHLSIALERGLDRREDISTAAFVEAIIRHTPRWYDMKVQLPYKELCLLKGAMPLLNTLTFGPTKELHNTVAVPSPLVSFDQAPNLRGVVLSEYFNPFCITLPWVQITSLSAASVDNEVAEILRHTTNLQEFRLSLYPFSHLADPVAAIPPLFHLHSFHLLAQDPDCSDGSQLLFRALKFPVLQTLKVFEPLLGDYPLETLSSLCPRQLQRIEVVGARTSKGQYRAVFPDASVSVEYAPPSDGDSDTD
ncbi:hypothetical protein C8R44DRAFT_877353 [Mycena epipterygia]|nr:hypothetical protein C8R44DRAFT_877353 [Mycena epipterygia]